MWDRLQVGVWHDGISILNATLPLYSHGELVSTLALQGVIIPTAGTQVLQVRVAYDSNLADFTDVEYSAWVIPGWLSLLPPVVMLGLMVALHNVVVALAAGIFVALSIIYQGNLLLALLRTLDTYIVDAAANRDHVKVLVFTWLLGAMVAIIYKSGGGYGLAGTMTKRIASRRGVQLAAVALGVAIFFDDYANSLIIGAALRSTFDRFYVSREKFCFLVDCTAAPVASIAPLSSWIGFELSLIQEQIDTLVGLGEGPALQAAGITNAYPVFLHTIPSRFYSICMLFFVLASTLSGRDFGPMLAAERRALHLKQVAPATNSVDDFKVDSDLEPEPGTPSLWWNAISPIIFTLAVTMLALGITGWQACLEQGLPVTVAGVLGNGDATSSIIWGTFAGLVLALLQCRLQWFEAPSATSGTPGKRPILTIGQSSAAALEGMKGLMGAVITLILAWAIGRAVQDVGCAQYISGGVASGVPPALLPALTFVAAALVALCTGTSWGTMAILFPAVVPAAWLASRDPKIWHLVISAILAGSVFGDHTSAVSDTTILSSMACRCNLRQHVVTQGVYGATVATVAMIFGYLGCGLLWPVWCGLGASATATVLAVLLLGRRVDDVSANAVAPQGCVEGLREAMRRLARRRQRQRLEMDCAPIAPTAAAGDPGEELEDP